jgi:hypothetical protein
MVWRSNSPSDRQVASPASATLHRLPDIEGGTDLATAAIPTEPVSLSGQSDVFSVVSDHGI